MVLSPPYPSFVLSHAANLNTLYVMNIRTYVAAKYGLLVNYTLGVLQVINVI